MKDILEKISSYNIFTNLLPGAVFAVLTTRLTPHNLIQPDIVAAVALYYFLGMVLSRTGATIVIPLLKKAKMIAHKPYEEYLTASKLDPLISKLVESGNMYRSMLAIPLALAAIKSYDYVAQKYHIDEWIKQFVVLSATALLFYAAYRRNSRFISDRVAHALEHRTPAKDSTQKD